MYAHNQNNQNAPSFAQKEEGEEEDDNIHDLLKDVLSVDKGAGNEKKPVKGEENGREEDILSKLLGG